MTLLMLCFATVRCVCFVSVHVCSPVPFASRKHAAERQLNDSLFPTRTANVKSLRTVTTKVTSLLQAGEGDDAYPVQGNDGSVDILWVPEIERFVLFCEVETFAERFATQRIAQ